MNNTQSRRMWLVAICLGFVGMILVGRLFVIQVIQRDEFVVGSPQQPIEDITQRGIIFDRNGAILAVNDWIYIVSVSPNIIRRPEELADALAPLLQIPRSELEMKMNSSGAYVRLAEMVSSDTARAIRQWEEGAGG